MKIKQYVNQKNQIKNGESYCGAAVIAMITGKEPQFVADMIGSTADDTKLENYLAVRGFKLKIIIDGGTQESNWAFSPTQDSFEIMRKVLDSGELILYHWAGWDGRSKGHYSVMTGYDDVNSFIFCDPAGSRIEGYFNNHGENIVYPVSMLAKAGIKRLWSIGE